MRELFIQIGRDTAKSRMLRELAIDEENMAKSNELRALQDNIYKKTEFKKNFLKARNELNDRERIKNN